MMTRWVWPVGLVLAVATGCGSDGSSDPEPVDDTPAFADPEGDGDGSGDGDKAGGDGDSAGDGDDPASDVPTAVDEDCGEVGLVVEGMMYSPGGTILPHPCEPYHPTHNNPYAIKCVEAWDWYETDFAGDEYCILPPQPGKGIQVGVHPQGVDWYEQVSKGDLSGYDDVPDEFLMDPSQEEERNYTTRAPNEDNIQFYRSYTRMRSGSHHMIVSATEAGTVGEWSPGSANAALGGGVLPGAQRPDDNVPMTLEKPEEDKGLWRGLAGNRNVVYNMHHFNVTDGVTLKEAWQNFWFEDDQQTRIIPILGLSRAQFAEPFAAPGEIRDHHFSWTIPEEHDGMRVVDIFGHRHAWTTNFSVWRERTDGSEEILYQSFDWFDMPTFRYDSVIENPVPMPEARRDGAATGIVTLNAGEKLHFNCHIEFTDERAAEEDAPSPTTVGNLRFANQAFTGEMCILFGSTVNGNLVRGARDDSPLPDFATAY